MEQTKDKIKRYFYEQVQPIFQTLITKIVMNRPQDILEFSVKYFKDPNKQITIGAQNSDCESERFQELSDEEFNKIKQMKRGGKPRKARYGVSSQVNGTLGNQRKPISLRKSVPKEQQTQIKILFFFMNSFMFQRFDEEEKKFLIESMAQQKTKNNQIIVSQGQYGDSMYFIEEGLFECSVRDCEKLNSSNAIRVLKNYISGDAFGELCLLHNAHRVATVISKTQGIIYSLSRDVYRHINKLSIVKRRTLYLQIIKKVSHFSTLGMDELEKVCDFLKQTTVQPGVYVVYEGDMGNKFYIVLSGLLSAKSNTHETFYQYYKQGDYFGEVALINKKPRQVSVQAVTKSRLVYLTSEVFLSIINREKADMQIKTKYKDTKPRTTARRKKYIHAES